MNNNEMNFDPMTGQPINKSDVNTTPISQQNIPIVGIDQKQPEQQTEDIQSQASQNNSNLFQTVPTVEQSKQDFINNTQALTPEKKEEISNNNYTFIIILFIIIFASIFFLFPILLKYI